MDATSPHAYISVVLHRFALPWLVALVACTDGLEDVCMSQQVSYQVEGRVSVAEGVSRPWMGAATSELGKVRQQGEAGFTLPGQLLISVWEATSIVACEGEIVTEQVPGRVLASVSVPASTSTFSLDVPATIYPALGRPHTAVEVWLDENENGRCDSGELSGTATLDPDEPRELAIELNPGGCGIRV